MSREEDKLSRPTHTTNPFADDRPDDDTAIASPTDYNPYAAPQTVSTSPPRVGPELEPISLGRTIVRWSLICVFGAAPSFFFGLNVCRGPFDILAMVLGVVAFIWGYVALEFSPKWSSTSLSTRRHIMAAFWTRVALSVVFPVAAINDMLCGLMSIQLGQFVFRGTPEQGGFFRVATTTVVQGILLNAEVWLFALVILGIRELVVFRQRRSADLTK